MRLLLFDLDRPLDEASVWVSLLRAPVLAEDLIWIWLSISFAKAVAEMATEEACESGSLGGDWISTSESEGCGESGASEYSAESSLSSDSEEVYATGVWLRSDVIGL